MGNVIAHEMRNIECRRLSEITGPYKLSYNIETPFKEIVDKVLHIDYRFTILYREGFGEIIVEGRISYKDTLGVLKKLHTQWDDHKEVQTSIYNLIIRNSISIVFDLSRHLGLPPPIHVPKLNLNKGE